MNDGLILLLLGLEPLSPYSHSHYNHSQERQAFLYLYLARSNPHAFLYLYLARSNPHAFLYLYLARSYHSLSGHAVLDLVGQARYPGLTILDLGWLDLLLRTVKNRLCFALRTSLGIDRSCTCLC